MDNFDELLEQMLCRLYTNIIYGEEKILKDMIGESLSLKEFHTLDVIFNTSQNHTNTASNIAKHLNISQSTLTINIDRLILKGYVQKVKNDLDRRVTYLTLTSKGSSVRNKHENLHKKAIRASIKDLAASEKVSLYNAISKLRF